MPTACILYDGTEFVDSARAAKEYFASKGFTVHMAPFVSDVSIEDFPTAPGGCDVSLWLSHGGWDGPMIFSEPEEQANSWEGQVDPSTMPAAWLRLKTWLKTHIRPGGMLISHSCHSAGSHRWEPTEGEYGERWVHQVARDMNLFTAGVEGSTSSANRYDAVNFLRFALEGRRWRQPSRAYRPGGQRAVQWSGWLNK